MKNFKFLIIILFVFNQCTVDNDNITVTDCNRCIGDEVQICDQVWMSKNLDVDRYQNGDTIRHAQTTEEWLYAYSEKEGAWCYYNNDPANGEIYGKLYNWYTVIDSRGLAPEGWHIPTEAEWKELEMCLGMTKTESDKTGW